MYPSSDVNSDWLNFLCSKEEKPIDKIFTQTSNLISGGDTFVVDEIM